MISPCVRCGRMIVSGSRCPSCQCGRCGGATDQSRWGVCPKCDAKDLALADSDDLAGIRRRLDTLLVENDGARHVCRRCRGFGVTETGSGKQVLATCGCADGLVRRPVAADAPAETGDKKMVEVRQGNLIASEYRAMWTQRYVAGAWIPYAKVVARYAKEFGVSEQEGARAIDQLIRQKYLQSRDLEAEPKSARLFEGDEFLAKQRKSGAR